MRVGLLTQWYDPEPGPAALPGVLARGLRSRGHEVQVLTGFPNYPTGRLADNYKLRWRQDERRDDVDIRRVALYPSHDASAVRRAANYASFGASATAFGMSALRGVEALWVNYSPITVGWPMWLARFLLGIPTVVHILDLWPDTVLAGGFAQPGRAYRVSEKVLNVWCENMYAAANSVAYISPGVAAILKERGVAEEKLHYVPMWADEEIFRPSTRDLRREFGIQDDQIVLLYAGALGEAQGLSTLIEACSKVTDPRFVCLIAGSGVAESRLRTKADGSDNVRFLGRVPQTKMTELMATGDINYIGLRTHGLSLVTMPSKTQATLASGCAVLLAAEGDVAEVIRQSKAGFVVHPDNVAGITDAIEHACRIGRDELRRIGQRGLNYYQRAFSIEQGVSSIEHLLASASSTKGHS